MSTIQKQYQINKMPGGDANGDNELFEFIITTNSVDRDNDIVSMAGLKLDNFRNNPVVLFNHDRSKIVGRAANLNVEQDRITAQIEFPEKGISKLCDEMFGMVKAGFINAVSIGFKVEDMEYNEVAQGLMFNKSELLEISLVSIPANPEALRLRKEFKDKTKRKKRLELLKLKHL